MRTSRIGIGLVAFSAALVIMLALPVAGFAVDPLISAQAIYNQAASYPVGTQVGDGECKTFANEVFNAVAAAAGSGARLGGGYYTDFINAGGVEVSPVEAIPGDIIQLNKDGDLDGFYWGMHTAVIAQYGGSGSFEVIDSNLNNLHVVARHVFDAAQQAVDNGLSVHIWRLGTSEGVIATVFGQWDGTWFVQEKWDEDGPVGAPPYPPVGTHLVLHAWSADTNDFGDVTYNHPTAVNGRIAALTVQGGSVQASITYSEIGHASPEGFIVATLTGNTLSGSYNEAKPAPPGRIHWAGPVTLTRAGTSAVTSFLPTSGPVGTGVTLTGTGFAGAIAVAFKGAAATFNVDSATQITATVPPTATTGPISVTTAGGSAVSAASFAVTATPITPKVTLKLSGLTAGAVRLGEFVTATGAVTPLSLAGSRVVLSVQMKTGATWVKVKATSASSRPVGNYRWKYIPVAEGAYRMRASIAATAAYPAATTAWCAFQVKSMANPDPPLGDRTWVVRNASGKKIGTVRLFSKAHDGGIIARVSNNAGARRGFLYGEADGGYMAAMGTPENTVPRAYLRTSRHGANPEWDLYSLNNPEHAVYVGRVIKRSGRWYPQTVGDFYHDMGSLPDSAPAWVASGSVFCLDSWWWTWP